MKNTVVNTKIFKLHVSVLFPTCIIHVHSILEQYDVTRQENYD